jgi:hypothetical protein
MMDEPNDEKRLRLYELIMQRYKDLINEKEEKSVSQIRQKITPYDEYIKSLKEKLIEDLLPYEYDKHFFLAVQKTIEYVKKIETSKLGLTFWMDFEKIDEIKSAGAMDKALLLTTLLRSLDSKDAKVIVSKSGKIYVGFSWNEEKYLIVLDSGSLLAGEDSIKAFEADPMAYSFSDLFYESYEES